MFLYSYATHLKTKSTQMLLNGFDEPKQLFLLVFYLMNHDTIHKRHHYKMNLFLHPVSLILCLETLMFSQ